MAYMSQEKKAKIAARLKAEFPKWSFRISVQHHTGVVVSIVRADVDFLNIAKAHKKADKHSSYFVNRVESGMEVYGDLSKYFGNNQKAIQEMQKLFDAVNLIGDSSDENFDKSDSQSDYFHVGYYTYIRIGGRTESTEFKYVPAKVKAAKAKKVVKEVQPEATT